MPSLIKSEVYRHRGSTLASPCRSSLVGGCAISLCAVYCIGWKSRVEKANYRTIVNVEEHIGCYPFRLKQHLQRPSLPFSTCQRSIRDGFVHTSNGPGAALLRGLAFLHKPQTNKVSKPPFASSRLFDQPRVLSHRVAFVEHSVATLSQYLLRNICCTA